MSLYKYIKTYFRKKRKDIVLGSKLIEVSHLPYLQANQIFPDFARRYLLYVRSPMLPVTPHAVLVRLTTCIGRPISHIAASFLKGLSLFLVCSCKAAFLL